MQVSHKCQYTLRALFELAKRRGKGPLSAAQIATAQAIPPRFLELILHGLRHSGEVESRRGATGGYLLAVSPDAITVGDIIRSVDGSSAPVKCVAAGEETQCPLKGRCAFMGLWERAQQAIEQVYDTTTLKDLVDGERCTQERQGPVAYSI